MFVMFAFFGLGKFRTAADSSWVVLFNHSTRFGRVLVAPALRLDLLRIPARHQG